MENHPKKLEGNKIHEGKAIFGFDIRNITLFWKILQISQTFQITLLCILRGLFGLVFTAEAFLALLLEECQDSPLVQG